MVSNQVILDQKSSEAIQHLVQNLEVPLASLIGANEKYSNMRFKEILEEKPYNELHSKSMEITNILNEFLQAARNLLEEKNTPIIYKIFSEEERIKNLYNLQIRLEKISDGDENWLMEFENNVYKHISYNNISLYDISSNLYTSERQLYRKIKKLINITPNKYIRIIKLHKAKQLIDSYTFETVSQVSYAIGYNDTHYFSQLFYNQYGIMPKKMLCA